MHRVAFLFVFSVAALAQDTGVLRGTVTDGSDGWPLPGATVALDNAGLAAVTGVDGRYRIESVPRGALRVWVSFVGSETAVVDTVLVGDSLRIDVALGLDCSGMGGMPINEVPRGVVEDDPGRASSSRYPSDHYVSSVDTEPMAARFSRVLTWDRGADALGRWRPTRRGLGQPQAYVDGMPALSVDGVPVQTAVESRAQGGYVPARFGGSAAGVVTVETAGRRPYSGSASNAFVGRSGSAGTVAVRASAGRARTDPARCHALIDRASLYGEGRVAVGDGGPRGDGRALAEYVAGPTGPVGHVRASRAETASGGTATLGGVVRVRNSPHDPSRFLAASALAASVDVRPDEAALAALRVERRGDVARVGVEATVESIEEAGLATSARQTSSALAAYGEASYHRTSIERLGRGDLLVTLGARAERFGTPGAEAAWAFQPRAIVELNARRASAFVYGAILSGPGTGSTLWRRSEVGTGGQVDIRFLGVLSSVASAHTYLRSVDGLSAGLVRGVDAEVRVPHLLNEGGLEVGGSVRVRTEWGDPSLAMDCWTATVDVSMFGYWTPSFWETLGSFETHVGGFVDVARGVGDARVVELGGYWVPGIGNPGITIIGRGVVVGRDAVPCVDGRRELACPAPVAEVAVRLAW